MSQIQNDADKVIKGLDKSGPDLSKLAGLPFSRIQFQEKFKEFFKENDQEQKAALECGKGKYSNETLTTALLAISQTAAKGLEEISAYAFVEIKKLRARVEELEAKPGMKYCGVYESNENYRSGEFVTHNGSVWYCRHATHDVPGESSAWQLAVKRGKDGRDAR